MLERSNLPESRISSGLKSKERWNSPDIIGDTGKTYKELLSAKQVISQKVNSVPASERMKAAWADPEFRETRRLNREAKLKKLADLADNVK